MLKRIILSLIAISLLLLVAGCGGGSSSSPSSTQYKPSGTDILENSEDWGELYLYDNSVNIPYDYLAISNNVWNKVHAASGPNSQKVFLETINGKQACGWQWEWAMSNDVVAYPELITGAKPWNTRPPYDRSGKFPFLAGTKDLTANFDIRLEAEGKYNMAFTMWAVSNPDTGAQSITHEVMIWNYNHGGTPAGTKRGTVTVDGVDFDVFVNENQHDNSGGSSAVWKYVAFVAKSPVLRGPFHISQFIVYMINHSIMSGSDYICSLELGNEIIGGKGIAEIQNFSLDITDKT